MSADRRSATPAPDPRRNAYRDDLADERLKGKVQAAHFAPGVLRQVLRPSVPLRRNPDASVSFDTEAIFGEVLTVFDTADGWAWIQSRRDNYVGYIPADAITADVRAPSHKVTAPGTFVYPDADMKTPPLMHLSINSQLSINERSEKFCQLANGGYVVSRHIAPIDRYARDFVDVAEQLIGTPYLWGGRTRLGVDCSGLVQLSLEAAGIQAPRDSDMQQAELGDTVLVPENLEGLARGDLIFWPGHVGIMMDGIMLLHANAHHMAVVVETLPEAAERIEKSGSKIIAIKRIGTGPA